MSSTTAESLARWKLVLCALAAMVVWLCVPSRAFAQSDSKVAAETMFANGKRQMAAGEYAQACKSFAESQSIDPSVGTLLNLALCNEKQGKLATAWVTYKEAAGLARSRGDAEREKAAVDFANGLEPKLAKLTVVARQPVAGLVVKRDGQQVGGLGIAVPIDPGDHVIEASAPGYKSWSARVRIGGGVEGQTVEIPILERGAGSTRGPDIGGAGGGGGDGLKIAGFVVGGVGIGGVVLGAVFGSLAGSTASDAEDDPSLCPNKVCTPAGREEIDTAETQALVSTIGFVVGGVAIAGGVVMVVLGFTQSTEMASLPLGLRPVVAIDEGGAYAGFAIDL